MSKKPLFILFFTLLLVAIGFGIVIPVLPYYTEHFHGDALTVGLLMASYSAMGFLFAPVWGRLSDRIGRKRVLLVGIGGYAVHFLVFGLATSIPTLFAARILGGILAAAALPTAMAYVGDVTTEEKRAKGMGLMGMAMGLGVVIGPGIGGLAGTFKLPAPHEMSLPYFLAAALAAATMVMASAILPESKPEAPTRRTGFLEAMRSEGGRLWQVLGLNFAQMFVFTGFEATFILFAEHRFHWSVGQVGGLFALMGFLGAMVQGGGAGRLINRMGEDQVIRLGLAIFAVGFLALAFAPNGTVCAALMCFTGLGSGFLRPAFSTWVSRSAATGQGAALGLMSGVESLARVFGPAVGGALYLVKDSDPYLMGGALMVVALVFSAVALPRGSAAVGAPAAAQG